eukprot:TRINITY_DN18667_c0_g1_i5.p1 TRINITY_DN18667_c0_g1~~TRINITY_DN18667_c0_g1_i5.p1  ORF type:complete len:384 (-),score=104.06 TRINITY_DN18667_c0_g1_i5:217-1368(-)
MVAGPYIWHVKDEEPLETKRDVQTHWTSPYFFNQTAANWLEAWDSFEFWFSLPGGGAFAHSDSYCEMTISAQLSGVKTWRLMMFPEVQNVFESFESFDTGVYRANKWSPEYEFEVGPGQCFLFPPGYMHETLVKPSQNPECTVATTFQFNLPFPTKYIRNFLPRLFSSHLVWAENCHSRWEAFHSLSGTPLRPTIEMSELEARVASLFAQIDSNRDKHLDHRELVEFLSQSKTTRWARAVRYSWSHQVSEEKQRQVQQEQLESRAADTISYNDMDDDGEVSFDELLASTHQWNVLNHKFHKLKRLNPRSEADTKKALAIEKEYHDKYRCGSQHDPRWCMGEDYFKALERRVQHLAELQAYQDLYAEQGGDEDPDEPEHEHDEM